MVLTNAHGDNGTEAGKHADCITVCSKWTFSRLSAQILKRFDFSCMVEIEVDNVYN